MQNNDYERCERCEREGKREKRREKQYTAKTIWQQLLDDQPEVTSPNEWETNNENN